MRDMLDQLFHLGEGVAKEHVVQPGAALATAVPVGLPPCIDTSLVRSTLPAVIISTFLHTRWELLPHSEAFAADTLSYRIRLFEENLTHHG
ncbi:unnamed protein product [Amoebophrya sp. A25]|nr:unnamed protein product [Amoebophrya sp. A25]|eukprot:GSA25T00017119001.1